MRIWWRVGLAVAASVLLAGSATASSSHAVRPGAAPRLPSGSSIVGALSSSTRMTVTVVLRPRDAAGLEQYATAVSTPGSSVYHQFLSVAGFRQRFGPTDQQIAAVAASLRAHGLDPGSVSPNGLALPVRATAGAIGHAFSTQLTRVALPGGRSAFVNSRAPLIDASVAGVVQDIVGLNDLAVPRPLALHGSHAAVPHALRHVVTGGPQPCAAATTAASNFHSYTADQIASAYGFPGLYGAGDFGAGQTVAIYELEGNFHSDITAYESCYGATAPVSYSAVDGGPPAPSFASGDGLETALDVENVVGLAPRASVIVYQGPNSNSNLPGAGPFDVYNAIVSADAAKVISTSWGICEAQDTPVPTAQLDENTLFQEAAVQGQSVFAAAGDNGSEDCVNPVTGSPQPGLAADDPGTQPFVTSAGGTRLSAIGPPPTETVWNDPASSFICANPLTLLPAPCGGGGGISELWRMPSYQAGAPGALQVINANSSGTPCGAPAGSFCREVPDVSGNADPATGYTIYYHGNGSPNNATGWSNGTPVGGTSAVAPLWAALMADVNASGACGGRPIGFANPALYGTASHVYAGHFNDVTVGNNDILGTNGGRFPAGAGYDMASGLGTPNAAALASNLCAPAIGISNPGSRTSRLRRRVSLPVIASDSAGYPVSYSATGLPPGLSISGTTGVVSGSPTRVGVYSVTVRAADARGSFGTTTFSWRIQGLPKASRASLTGIANGRPKLSFTLTAGTLAPKLKKVVVSLPKGFSFARDKRSLKRGIKLPASLKVKGGKLVITLKSGARRVRPTIAWPALRVSHSGHRKLTFTLQPTDVSGFTSTIKLKLRPS